jgi:hypothetical protein
MPIALFPMLLSLAPGILSLLIEAIMSVESIYSGVGKGSIKKNKVMDLINSVLVTKNYFANSDDKIKSEILELIDQAIDVLVGVFNTLNIFTKEEEKVDLTPTE